jgi:hypothetical protein
MSRLEAVEATKEPGTQAAIAGEIATLGRQLHDLLATVFSERVQIGNTERAA